MNENVEVYFRIEEWIPAENAISGKGMYYPLHDGQIKDESVAIVLVNKLRGQGRNVRMVKVTEEVVWP